MQAASAIHWVWATFNLHPTCREYLSLQFIAIHCISLHPLLFIVFHCCPSWVGGVRQSWTQLRSRCDLVSWQIRKFSLVTQPLDFLPRIPLIQLLRFIAIPWQPLCFIAFHCFMGCIGTYGCLLTWGQPYLFQRLSSLDSLSFYIFLVLELCAKDHLLQSSEIHVAHCSCVLHCVLLLGEKGGSFLKGQGVLAKVETEMRFTHYLSQLFIIIRNVVANACETPLLINALRFIVFNCNLRQTCTCSGHTIAIGHMSIRMTITYELMRQYRHVLHIFLQLLTCRMSWWCPVDHSLYASKLRIGLATNHKFALWRATDSHLSLCLSWVLDPAWGN